MPNGDRPAHAVVAIIRKGIQFLAIKRSASVRAPGKICFPGGGIEEGESEVAALKRELHEELSVEIVPAKKVWQSQTPWGIHVHWYTAMLNSERITVNTLEVEWCRWMDVSEMRQSPDLLVSNADFFRAWQANAFELD